MNVVGGRWLELLDEHKATKALVSLDRVVAVETDGPGTVEVSVEGHPHPIRAWGTVGRLVLELISRGSGTDG